MNFKTLKNSIAAAAIGATTLAGCTAKNANTATKSVPEMSAQIRASVKEAAEAFQKAQAKFTTDSIAFSNKPNKTALDTLAYNVSKIIRDDAKITNEVSQVLGNMNDNIITQDLLNSLKNLENIVKSKPVK